MKKYYQVAAIFISLAIITSCNKAFRFDGKKVQEVTITDLGEMYSTYNLSETEKVEIKNQISSEALFDEVIRYSNETMWPEAVNTLDKRLIVRTTMMNYHYYKVASFGNKTIVSIPKEKNGHMPVAFIPDRPMYIIFSSSVVARK